MSSGLCNRRWISKNDGIVGIDLNIEFVTEDTNEALPPKVKDNVTLTLRIAQLIDEI